MAAAAAVNAAIVFEPFVFDGDEDEFVDEEDVDEVDDADEVDEDAFRLFADDAISPPTVARPPV